MAHITACQCCSAHPDPFRQLRDDTELTFELKVNFESLVNAGATLASTLSGETAEKLTHQQINLAAQPPRLWPIKQLTH